jgi:anaerobic magnesium-protoporphyrin IX monomethyl ester cyclase
MKVLLITPASKYARERWLPLGLSYISAILKENRHEVRLYDRFLKGHCLNGRNTLDEDMKKAIIDFGPDMIGFTTISPLIHDTVECVEKIRRFYDGIMVAGGHHATALPGVTLEKIPGLDYAAVGEAEHTMRDLAGGKDPETIPGIISRTTDPNKINDVHIKYLDDLPSPDYGIFDMNYYMSANHHTIKGFYLRTACVLSSRGCPNSCEFCSESLTFGRGMRFHSPEYVIDNIERLVIDYGAEGIYFHDNNFLASPAHSEDICRGLIRSGLSKKIRWEMQTGTPTINDKILPLLSEAGCIKIELGIESIREKDLKDMNKNADTGINSKAIDLCHEYGINTHTNFMTGFEGETIQDLNNMIEWIRKSRPHTFSLHRMQIYPGTRLYDRIGDRFFENNEWTEENVLEYFNRPAYRNISIEERQRWHQKIYRPFNTRYIRKSIVKVNTLPKILKIFIKKILGRK